MLCLEGELLLVEADGSKNRLVRMVLRDSALCLVACTIALEKQRVGFTNLPSCLCHTDKLKGYRIF